MVISRGEPRTQKYHDRNDIRKHTYDDIEMLYRLLGKANWEAEKARNSVTDLLQENRFLKRLLTSESDVDRSVQSFPASMRKHSATACTGCGAAGNADKFNGYGYGVAGQYKEGEQMSSEVQPECCKIGKSFGRAVHSYAEVVKNFRGRDAASKSDKSCEDIQDECCKIGKSLGRQVYSYPEVVKNFRGRDDASKSDDFSKSKKKNGTEWRTPSQFQSKYGGALRKCKFCDVRHLWGSERCPAFGKKCSKCKKLNHYAKVCKYKLNKSQSKEDKFCEEIQVENKSGAGITNDTEATFLKIGIAEECDPESEKAELVKDIRETEEVIERKEAQCVKDSRAQSKVKQYKESKEYKMNVIEEVKAVTDDAEESMAEIARNWLDFGCELRSRGDIFDENQMNDLMVLMQSFDVQFTEPNVISKKSVAESWEEFNGEVCFLQDDMDENQRNVITEIISRFSKESIELAKAQMQ